MVESQQQQEREHSQSKKHDDLLSRLYGSVNEPSCFTSLQPLLQAARQHVPDISAGEVQEFLQRHATYTLHRRVVRKFKRLPTLAAGLHTDWQADLCVLMDIKASNDGYAYILVCIDTLSRQLFVAPVHQNQRAHD
jgi:hypothetical protein